MINKLYDVKADEIIPPSFININKYWTNEDRQGDYYLYLRRLVDAKGVMEIVESFNKLKIPLRIAGKGPLKSDLIREANENVDILGYVSESKKHELLSNCKGLVHNTIAEPFGVVLVEALASGAPIVNANACNSSNIIKHGETGVLFNRQTGGTTYQRPQSPEPIIDAVQKAEAINWDHKHIHLIARKYDRDNLIKKWERLLETVS